MSNLHDMLKTPAPPSMVKGKVVWYQYPQTNNGPKISEVINEMDDKQESGDYLLFGVCSGSTIDYGLTVQPRQLVRTQHVNNNIVNTFPNYYFFGVDRKFINKFVSYGYNINGHGLFYSGSEHQTFVFKKK
uniref:Uncharacterized protein n=1 Tax=Amphimedon queenslandica TaxID=400682 RepID=A0A1X7TIU8_AMPQE